LNTLPQTTVEEFDLTRVTNVGIKFEGDEQSIVFGGLGEIEGETTLSTLVKKVEGVEVKSKSTPQKMALTLNMHVKVAPYRKLFGLSNTGLKPGVYAYGSDSKGLPFILTADALDEFQNLTKKMAWPNCSSDTGLLLHVENGQDEVAELELKISAMVDPNKKCYYEALVEELQDPSIATQWDQAFGYELVAQGATVAVTGVSVAPSTVNLTVGETASLVAAVAPVEASNKLVTWTSSDTAIATVSGAGVVTKIAAGTATITAKSQSDPTKLGTCEVMDS
jgi:uncharacterized protein YjdB